MGSDMKHSIPDGVLDVKDSSRPGTKMVSADAAMAWTSFILFMEHCVSVLARSIIKAIPDRPEYALEELRALERHS